MESKDERLLDNSEDVILRPIRKEDNKAIAAVIRSILEEHGVNRPGTVYTDPTTDDLYGLFSKAGSVYFIATHNETIIGGCGIYPTLGLPEKHAELVKLYLLKRYRGSGIGKALMEASINYAKEFYDALYLETMPELANAIDLYKNLGFEMIENRLGESGHFSCDIWMVKQLH